MRLCSHKLATDILIPSLPGGEMRRTRTNESGHFASFWWVMVLLTSLSVSPAAAEKRVALVIGNSTYRNITPLDNPSKDAGLMADTLSGLGFTLVGSGAQLNLDKPAMDKVVQDFGQRVQGAD